MKIRFVRPLPRIDHVIPAGFVLDAPEGFAQLVAEEISRTELSLPMYYGMKDEEIQYVIDAVNAFRG